MLGELVDIRRSLASREEANEHGLQQLRAELDQKVNEPNVQFHQRLAAAAMVVQ